MEQHGYPAFFIHYPKGVPEVLATSVVAEIQNTTAYKRFTTEFLNLAQEEIPEVEIIEANEDDLMTVKDFIV